MLEIVSFICGASVMIMELAGARIIAPFLGSTFIVWTSIIGIIMASLSVGYWLGGRLSDKNPSSSKLSVIIFLAGVYIIFLSFFQFRFLDFLTEYNINLYLLSLISGICLFMVPSVLLGMVSPYIINYAIKLRNIPEEKIGGEIGKFYALSTIGSIAGTFLCGFYLILFFGIKSIFLFLGGIIIICSVLALLSDKEDFKKKRLYLILQLVLVFIAFFSIYYNKKENLHPIENTIASYDSPYAYIGILEQEFQIPDDNGNEQTKKIRYISNYKNLKYGAHTLSYISEKPGVISKMYYIYLFNRIYNAKSENKSVLLLGIAGNALLNTIFNNTNVETAGNTDFDMVEIDPCMVEIAKKYFFYTDSKKVKLYIKDARSYINRLVKSKNKDKYDIIFHDIYNSDISIPYETITIEALKNIRYILKENGILAINIIADLEDGNNEYFSQIYRQLKEVFPVVKIYAVIPDELEEFQNYILVGFKSNNDSNNEIINNLKDNEVEIVPKEQPEVFTDDFAPFEKFFIYKN